MCQHLFSVLIFGLDISSHISRNSMVLAADSVAEAYKCIDLELLSAKHLEQGVRLDGRKLMESRPVMVSVSDVKSSDSSSTVRVGRTKVSSPEYYIAISEVVSARGVVTN